MTQSPYPARTRMIHLHTLGDSLITVDEKEIRPTAPLIFAVLLYLGIERGRRVPRTALQELLFPETDERSGAHSLRQLLYKLRQLGVPIDADSLSISLPSDVVVVDSDSADATNGGCLDRLAVGVLPGIRVPSEAFATWLDALRAATIGRFRTQLLSDLRRVRDTGDRAAMERLAIALLQIDPLNEEATLGRAEALALGGQKLEAIRLLEKYSAEVGAASPQLRLAPDLLRKRIIERVDTGQRSRVPLVGRQPELSWLLAQYARAAEGSPTITMLWGDAGIGKTRLVEEFAAHLVFRRVRVESVQCQQHDADRPLGALLDLVSKLLEARGALGISMDAMTCLRRLVGDESAGQVATAIDPDRMTSQIRAAVSEILASVASEGTFVLFVEDAHWLDDASRQLLLNAMPSHDVALHLAMTLRHRPTFSFGTRLSPNVFVRRLEPLDENSAHDLLSRATRGRSTLTDAVRSECVALGAGNPLFLLSIAEHLRLQGAAPSARTDIADLLRQRARMLDASSLLLIRAIAALGNNGTMSRVESSTEMPATALLLGVQDLSDRGLLTQSEGMIRCSHVLLAEAVINDIPAALRVALFRRVARVLEADAAATKHVGLFWSAAEAWRLALDYQAAVDTLKRTADVALDSSQPDTACLALERAQDLVRDDERANLIERTIRVADQTRAHVILIRNVDRYRELTANSASKSERIDTFELLRIRSAYATGQPTWHMRDRILSVALDPTASISDRILATRAFMSAAAQQLAICEATQLGPVIDELEAITHRSGEALASSLVFHMLFGEMGKIPMLVSELSGLQKETNAVWSLALNMGTALLYSGDVEFAARCLEGAVQHSEQLGLHTIAVTECGQLAALHIYSGDACTAQYWHDRGEHHLQCVDDGYASLQRTNAIALALMGRNTSVALQQLNVLKTCAEANTPQATRCLRAFEILIAHQDGTLAPSTIDLSELRRIDDGGRTFVEHHFFAAALHLALSCAGERLEAQQRLEDYLTRYRRERYSLERFFGAMITDEGMLADVLASI